MKNAFFADSQREYQVIIKFSRLAKRRAALYKIPESAVERILAEETRGRSSDYKFPFDFSFNFDESI